MMQTFLVGLLALLPLALTVAAVGWLVNLMLALVGTESTFEQALVGIGLPIFGNSGVAYAIGLAMVTVAVYVLGLFVRRGFAHRTGELFEKVIRSTPVVGQIYDMAARLVAMIDTSRDTGIEGMTPAWCFLGGRDGAAVLGLMPTAEPVRIGDDDYLGVLVPTAPIPFGGALIYVRADWVDPADIGIDGLTSIYATMGVTTPEVIARIGEDDDEARDDGLPAEPAVA